MFLFLFISCAVFSQQKEFEEVLGEVNVVFLNHLIKDFEDAYLGEKYSGLKPNKAYKQLLKDCSTGKLNLNESTLILENKKKFDESEFKLDVYCYAKELYLGKSSLNPGSNSEAINVVYDCKKTADINAKISSSISCCKTSKETKKLMTELEKSKRINLDGLFFKALKAASIKPNKIALKEYIDVLEATASIAPTVVSQGMLYSNIDTGDYILKRIILLHIIYGITV